MESQDLKIKRLQLELQLAQLNTVKTTKTDESVKSRNRSSEKSLGDQCAPQRIANPQEWLHVFAPGDSSAPVLPIRLDLTSHLISLHTKLQHSPGPNTFTVRLPVPSGLQVHECRARLQDYYDTNLCHFLEYGWPVGYMAVPHLLSKIMARLWLNALSFNRIWTRSAV